MVRPNPTRVLVWMCVLIAVNQLGFGSVVPVLALYARSFGVTQSAIGLAIAVYGLGPLPGGVLAERFGLAAPFLIYAVAGTLAAVVAWFQIPETRATGMSAADAAAPPPFAAQVRLLTSHAGFVLVALVSFMNAVA